MWNYLTYMTESKRLKFLIHKTFKNQFKNNVVEK